MEIEAGPLRHGGDIGQAPLDDANYLYLLAANLVMSFTWAAVYPPSATVDKRLGRVRYDAAHSETLVGAILYQMVAARVLIVVAAAHAGHLI